MLSFAHLWQQAELSDVDVLLTAPSTTDQNSNAPPQKLAEFPGHTVLLSSSPYLKAQVHGGSHVERQNDNMIKLWSCWFNRLQDARVHAGTFPGAGCCCCV
jgi:hypothetical protein